MSEMQRPMVSQTRRLPVWRTVKASYLALFRNAGLALKLAAIPFGLSILYNLYSTYAVGPPTAETLSDTAEMSFGSDFAVFALGIASSLAVIPTITAWHRLVLRGFGRRDARLSYSIRNTEWLYFGKLILYYVIIVLTSILLVVATVLAGVALERLAGHSQAMASFSLLVALVLVWAFYIGLVLRLSLVFPAAAIEAPFTFRASWRYTRNNTWRLIFIHILCAIPVIVVSGAIMFAVVGSIVLDAMNPETADVVIRAVFQHQILLSFLNVPVGIMSLCVMTSLWSWAYRYLVQGEEIVLPGERG